MKNPFKKHTFAKLKKAAVEFTELRKAEKEAKKLVEVLAPELETAVENLCFKEEFSIASKSLFYCEDSLWKLVDLEKNFDKEDIETLEFMVRTLKLTTSNLQEIATRLKKR